MAELSSTTVYGDLTVSGDMKGNLQPATPTRSGSMSAADKAKLDAMAPAASSTTLGGLKAHLAGTTLYLRNDGANAQP